MQFSNRVLTSTAKQFSNALAVRGLSLSFSKDRDLWTQIVVGKNYSAAKSQANAQGFVPAIAVTADAIRSKLKRRSRDIAHGCAEQLFSEAIKEDLPDLSYCMTRLVRLVIGAEKSCLISAGTDRTKLGLMNEQDAGYLALGTAGFFDGKEQETAWIRASADLVAEVINTLAQREKISVDIRTTNFKLACEKADRVFAAHMSTRVEYYSRLIGKRMINAFDPSEQDGFLEFDKARDTVYSVFERELHERPGDGWLKLDCDLAEAMMDHIAARFRDATKWVEDADEETFAHTAKLCMWTSLKMRKP